MSADGATASPPCLGIEACATAHHWARVLTTLGHEVRLMPASYVKPYVKRQKNDATDAEAIYEAVTRPMLVNALRGHLAEFGVVTRQGIAGVGTPIALVEHEKVSEMDRQIHTWHRSNELSRRLETVPGIGPITASAIAATVADATLFKSGRQLAAWIGLVPRRNSSGGKDRLGRSVSRAIHISSSIRGWCSCRASIQRESVIFHGIGILFEGSFSSKRDPL